MRSFFIQLFVFLFCYVTFAQEKTPFAIYDFLSDQEYQNKLEILQKKNHFKRIISGSYFLATDYKDYETVISYYSKLIKNGFENAEYYFRLAGANGTRIDEISKFKVLPHVDAMKTIFLKAHELNPEHTPTLMALVKVYAKLPGFLGGSFLKARKYEELLSKQSHVEGMLAKGFILEVEDKIIESKYFYSEAFKQLSFLDDCNQEEIEAYFDNRSQNLSYEIASIDLDFNLNPNRSICSLTYFLEKFDMHDNLPKDWVYYKLALLHKKINKIEKADKYRSLALEINSKFKL
tara:strand:+ start:2607 stop:3479 length:873 start_codon:yes stop_codon:yes gene_type:complete